MTVNDVAANRRALDLARRDALEHEKDSLLSILGFAPEGRQGDLAGRPSDRIAGLLLWYFGGESSRYRDPREIPLPKIKNFARHYLSLDV